MSPSGLYTSSDEEEEARRIRRYRRDLMFVVGSPAETVASGVVAALTILPVLLVPSALAIVVFGKVVAARAAEDMLVSGAQPGGGAPPESSVKVLVIGLLVLSLTLAVAGGLSAWLRRRGYLEAGGLQRYPERVPSRWSTAAFLLPVGLLFFVVLTELTFFRLGDSGGGVAQVSLGDRLLIPVVFAILVAGLLHWFWEALFTVVHPSLSSGNIDRELAQRAVRTRDWIRDEEDRARRLPWAEAASIRRERQERERASSQSPGSPMTERDRE
ncbi:MAG: hypothetical protein M1298_00570 [Chloroflexi bacterium]|nr:hypothetical protein [Chloroflexota bacterium]